MACGLINLLKCIGHGETQEVVVLVIALEQMALANVTKIYLC